MDQPEGTTTDCLNVRNYDALDRRNRGGQRTGIQKYIATAVNGANPIQSIGSVVLAFDSSTIQADTELFSKDFTGFADGKIESKLLTPTSPPTTACSRL
jgi:hypothetical protein